MLVSDDVLLPVPLPVVVLLPVLPVVLLPRRLFFRDEVVPVSDMLDPEPDDIVLSLPVVPELMVLPLPVVPEPMLPLPIELPVPIELLPPVVPDPEVPPDVCA